jgi:hypothetical protein
VRCFHLARTHLHHRGTVPTWPGELIIQGEDIGRRASAQRLAGETLLPAQQWLLAEILHLSPTSTQETEEPRTGRRTRAQMWADNLAAARQYQEREGHLNVPRRHVETVGESSSALGVFIASCRARKAALAPERVEELSAIGMRWI